VRCRRDLRRSVQAIVGGSVVGFFLSRPLYRRR
jgi:hypothetical protein